MHPPRVTLGFSTGCIAASQCAISNLLKGFTSSCQVCPFMMEHIDSYLAGRGMGVSGALLQDLANDEPASKYCFRDLRVMQKGRQKHSIGGTRLVSRSKPTGPKTLHCKCADDEEPESCIAKTFKSRLGVVAFCCYYCRCRVDGYTQSE
ncbi:hypothetical protein LY76DRAFT_590728 [Colletotrichum caudatum]|nr:hypothetical protein LY76DRAFT_590728 [Colletotrichum caudatum]